MRTWTAEPVTQAAYRFGEGLRHDAGAGAVLWVDLLDGRLHRAPLADLDAVETLADLDEPLSAFAPCASGGLVLARGRGLAHLAEDGAVTPLRELEPAGNRTNDAACDAQGRFWVGSMAYDETPGAGALHRVDLDGRVDQVLDDVTIANGPAFSPDGTVLYLDDSGRQVTTAYALDPVTGELGPGRELVHHSQGTGDGLVVDDDGQLWIALFGGSAVHRYDPSGRLTGRVAVAASQVTSCCLADGVLLMTTVRDGAEGEHDAGRLFAVDVGVGAPAVQPFRGVLPTDR
jgi:sugar lactone lactonase YvrE